MLTEWANSNDPSSNLPRLKWQTIRQLRIDCGLHIRRSSDSHWGYHQAVLEQLLLTRMGWSGTPQPDQHILCGGESYVE